MEYFALLVSVTKTKSVLKARYLVLIYMQDILGESPPHTCHLVKVEFKTLLPNRGDSCLMSKLVYYMSHFRVS